MTGRLIPLGAALLVLVGACASGSSGEGETCGDGIIDPGENCDGAALGGVSCSSLGLAPGQLSCATDDYSAASGDDSVNFSVIAGRTYYLVAEAYTLAVFGSNNYNLSLTCP